MLICDVSSLQRVIVSCDVMSCVSVTGIGPKFAARLIIDHGITSLAELRKNQHLLNAHQKLGLQFVDDFDSKIPRKEIQQMVCHHASA